MNDNELKDINVVIESVMKSSFFKLFSMRKGLTAKFKKYLNENNVKYFINDKYETIVELEKKYSTRMKITKFLKETILELKDGKYISIATYKINEIGSAFNTEK